MTGGNGKRGSATVHRKSEYWYDAMWHPVRITAKSGIGQAYVDLHFNDAKTPIEVINIYDYQTGESRLQNWGDQNKLGTILDAWIAEQDSQEILDQPDFPLRRDWLRTYIENNGE